MSYDTIQLEMRGQVCVLTLNRPDRLNALTVETANDFKAAVAEALEHGARAIVLTRFGTRVLRGWRSARDARDGHERGFIV